MAIAFDAVSSDLGRTDASNEFNVSHTVAAGSDRVILAGINFHSSPSIVSVTWNGDAMASAVGLEAFTDRNAHIYYLVEPDTGNHDLIVTMTGVTTIGVGVISLTGVDQSSPIGDTGSSSVDNKTGISTMITTTVLNSWLMDSLITENASTSGTTADGTQTERWKDGAAGVTVQAGSTDTTTSIDDYVMGWTWSYVLDREGVHVAAEIKPAVAAGLVSRRPLVGHGI